MRLVTASLARVLRAAHARYLAVCALVATSVAVAFPAASLATETEGETKVKEVATQVSTEGVTIILAILGALVALIALVIILPKAVKMVKRFI